MTSKDYYVYAYLDQRIDYNKEHLGIYFDYEPFYIGKGTKERCLDHLNLNCSNKIKKGKIKHLYEIGLIPHIIIIQYFNSDDDAKKFESLLIQDIGTIAIIRNVDKRGPLSNLTPGGDGGAGWKYMMENSPGYHERLSIRVTEYMNRPEVKKKLSDKKIGENNPMYNTTHPAERKKRIAESTSKSKSGTICITNGVKNRYIKPENIDKSLSDGWFIGMTVSDKLSKQITGRIHINNGIKSKMVTKDEIESYLKSGWSRGRIKKVNS